MSVHLQHSEDIGIHHNNITEHTHYMIHKIIMVDLQHCLASSISISSQYSITCVHEHCIQGKR